MKISHLPPGIKEKALNYQISESNLMDKQTDILHLAFDWGKTYEGNEYWAFWGNHDSNSKQDIPKNYGLKEPKHYDNSKGSLYQFCEQQGLNSYEFDIIKRVIRSRKKGNFLEDLEKTKFLIDLYIKEQYNNQLK
jgi:hypothetical protein